MSDAPNEPPRRASLFGKGWQILRGAPPPESGADEPTPQAQVTPPAGEDLPPDSAAVPPPESPELPEMAFPLEVADDGVQDTGEEDPLAWLLDVDMGASSADDLPEPDFLTPASHTRSEDEDILDWLAGPESVEEPSTAYTPSPEAARFTPSPAPPPEAFADLPSLDELTAALPESEPAAPAVEAPPTLEAAEAAAPVAPPEYAPRAEVESLSPAEPELLEEAIPEASPVLEAVLWPVPVALPEYTPRAEVESLTPAEAEALEEAIPEAPPMTEPEAAARLPHYTPRAEVEALTPAEPEALEETVTLEPEPESALLSVAAEGASVEAPPILEAVEAVPVPLPEYTSRPEVEALVPDGPEVIADTIPEASPIPETEVAPPMSPPTYAPRAEVQALIPVAPEVAGEPSAEGLTMPEAPAVAPPEGESTVVLREAGQQSMAFVAEPEGLIVPQDVRIDAGRLVPAPRASATDLIAEAKDVVPDEALLNRYVTDERLDRLWADLEELQNRVAGQVGGDRERTDLYQQELLKASALLLQSRANYDEVRAIVLRVRADLARDEQVVRDVSRYKPQIIRYLVLMFVLWLILMALEPLFRQFANSVGLNALSLIYHPSLLGMLGAIVSGYFTLNRHAIRLRDFDPAHVSWYLMNPLVGLVMGLLMALLFGAGIVSTLSAGVLNTEGELLNQYPFLLWVLCFLAGYNQNAVLRLLDRAFAFLRGEPDDSGSAPPSA